MRPALGRWSVFAAVERLSSSTGSTILVMAVNLGTVAILVAWLVTAGYAIRYLVSH
jgi:hypothetical protein